MMMLKDMQGRTVLIKHENNMEFYAMDGLNMVPVDEAMVFQGNDVFLTEGQVEDMLSKAGFPGLALRQSERLVSRYSSSQSFLDRGCVVSRVLKRW
jgi:hypothetical protein